ncbi:TPA: hypothetical protein L4R50_000109 [Pseudomonas aeruginosa]|nr:hypothetical protein [Pseudomonas aeruginosa]
MSYIRNFERPLRRVLFIPMLVIVAAAMFTVAFTIGMPWWGYALVFIAVICSIPFLSDKEDEPIEQAKAEYLEYLSTCSLQDMAKVVNDPNRPGETKAMIREHLNKNHAGWHEQLEVAEPARC